MVFPAEYMVIRGWCGWLSHSADTAKYIRLILLCKAKTIVIALLLFRQ